MYFAKTPLLVFYIRTFGIKRWLRNTCYIILVVTALIYLVCMTYACVHCNPSGKSLDAVFLVECTTSTYVTSICRCFTSVLTDVSILVLPLSTIFKLHLPFHKKIGLAVMVMSGIL